MRKLMLITLSLLLGTVGSMAQEVKVTEKPLVLPTYKIGAPDPNPIFFTGRVYQGAQGHVYPYPLYDVLTDQKVDKPYDAVYLENQYVNVCVLPEIGGRILSATDKTNNYEIFYRQTGIKPALIGMLGAWLSGGVEWNIPHHHRPSSYMPIDWKVEENPDGSKTVWVGETELRHRMKWSVGITVYPNRSWIEARVKVFNQTPFVQSMLYWANVSVHCDENYEVIFPPSTQFGTDHSKVYFTRWPMGEAVRGSGENVNLAWWKNYTGGSRSIFAWNFEDDFLAGYDHKKNAGTVHVANHHMVNGKKFFLWGNNPSGEMWNKMLSDKDGHYLELMVGAYSDNQPDYSWIAPGEVREFTQRWYGIRDLGSVKNANNDAAVNIERRSLTQMFLGFNTTTQYEDAKVQLKRGSQVVFEKTLFIDPSQPFTTTVRVSKDADDTEFEAVLLDKEGREIISYRPIRLTEKELPKVVEGTKPLKDYKTVEELYYAGLRIEQFHNARLDAMSFYEEALKRDSLDSRTNTAVGIHYARNGEWNLAEKYLKRALVRPTKDYTVTKESEPHYYLGLIYQMQGRYQEAVDQYWAATWHMALQHPSFWALAQIACINGKMQEALDLINRSIYVGSRDTKALTLKAYILRKLNRKAEAQQILEQALTIAPLDYWSLAEQNFLKGVDQENFVSQADKQRGEGIVRIQELLEVVNDYAQIGAYGEAASLTADALETGEPYTSSSLVHYYNGYFNLKLGNREEALAQWQQASVLTTDLNFPFRLEEIGMFTTICHEMPNDACAPYYLGCLYYFLNQKDKGISCWEQAVAKDKHFAQAYRNLGFGYNQRGQLQQAIAYYEQAVIVNSNDPRLLRELDILYEKAHKSVTERLSLLERHIATVMKHDEDVMRLLILYNETGAYDKAIEILSSRHFHVWEGGGEIHDIYVDSHLLRGISLLSDKQYAEAVKEFQAADLYPENLEVGRPQSGGHSAKGFYYMGKTYLQMGQKKKAQEAFAMASQNKGRGWGDRFISENTLFRALALKETGQTKEGDDLLQRLNDEINRQLEGKVIVDAYSKFGEDGSSAQRRASLAYLKGLTERALGKDAVGKIMLQKAIDLNPNLIWARRFLEIDKL